MTASPLIEIEGLRVVFHGGHRGRNGLGAMSAIRVRPEVGFWGLQGGFYIGAIPKDRLLSRRHLGLRAK